MKVLTTLGSGGVEPLSGGLGVSETLYKPLERDDNAGDTDLYGALDDTEWSDAVEDVDKKRIIKE